MKDFIILPDDKTIEKLAAEYAKVRAKTFAVPNEVKTLSIENRAENAKSSADCSDIVADIISLYQQSFTLLRKLENSASTVQKAAYRACFDGRRELLKRLTALKLHGNTASALEYKKPAAPTQKRLEQNLSDTLTKYSELHAVLSDSPVKTDVAKIRMDDFACTLQYLLRKL